MKKVIISSKNPVKVNAAKNGFHKVFSNEQFEFEGCLVPSGVSDQPMSDNETFIGAINRVRNAREEFPDSDYWVGIEGGIQRIGDEMMSFAWIYIQSKDGMVGKSRTSTFYLPSKVMKLIEEGYELGDADDIVFGKSNSKQINGSVGILTGDIITRESYYIEAIVLALIPFINKEIYKEE